MNDKTFFTTLEAAELCGVSRRTLQMWCQIKGYDGVHKVGNTWQIPRSIVNQIISTRNARGKND